MINGAISFNARGTGGMAVANTWLDLPFTLKALLAPGSDLLRGARSQRRLACAPTMPGSR